jgi:hypothetical protein
MPNRHTGRLTSTAREAVTGGGIRGRAGFSALVADPSLIMKTISNLMARQRGCALNRFGHEFLYILDLG